MVNSRPSFDPSAGLAQDLQWSSALQRLRDGVSDGDESDGEESEISCGATVPWIREKCGTWEPQVVCGYPLVNVYITMENHHFQWENSL